MSIERVEYTYRKPNTRLDSASGKYVGYKIYVRVGGRRYRETGFATKKEAQDYIDGLRTKHKYSRQGLKAPEKHSQVLLRHLIDKRLADIQDRVRKALAERVFFYLLDITGPAAKVEDLTYQHLKEFNTRRSKEKTVQRDVLVSESTVDREMTEISSMLKLAGEYFPALEDYQPPKIPRLRLSDNRRTRTISDDEMYRLLDHYARAREPNESDRQYADRITIGHALEFAWLTGSRRKEVVWLKRTDYFPDQDKLVIKRWKTMKAKKDSYSIFQPVPDRVRELLEIRMNSHPGDYFFSRNGKESHGYLKSLKLACEKLGIKYGRFTEGGLIFHDTRHTFVSMLLEDNNDLETTRELAGLSREMVLRYAHSMPQAKRNAAKSLNKKALNISSMRQKAATNSNSGGG
jgi:site-specific recombinase XerC